MSGSGRVEPFSSSTEDARQLPRTRSKVGFFVSQSLYGMSFIHGEWFKDQAWWLFVPGSNNAVGLSWGSTVYY